MIFLFAKLSDNVLLSFFLCTISTQTLYARKYSLKESWKLVVLGLVSWKLLKSGLGLVKFLIVVRILMRAWVEQGAYVWNPGTHCSIWLTWLWRAYNLAIHPYLPPYIYRDRHYTWVYSLMSYRYSNGLLYRGIVVCLYHLTYLCWGF